jgi:hypothetical protein
MKLFCIELILDGDPTSQFQRFRATSAGHAQVKCRRKNRGCIILDTWCDARVNKGSRSIFGFVSYPTVSTAKPEPLPVVKPEETTFAFFDECVSHRPQPTRQP